MSDDRKFRLPRLTRYLGFVAGRLVRETIRAETIDCLEPAEPRFDAPPDLGGWRSISVGDAWGAKQQWAWFRAAFAVQQHWTHGAIELRLRHEARFLPSPDDDGHPAGPEGQVFIDGHRGGAIDRHHATIRHAFRAGGRHDVRGVFFAGRCTCRHRLAQFELAWIDADAERLYHDLRVALEIAAELDESSLAREKLLTGVDAAIHALDLRDGAVEMFHESVPAARQAFDAIMAEVAPDGSAPAIGAVGHAHIDLAWLWPISQAHHKVVRTWSSMARLLRQYPHWVFLHSSPQAYAWVERDAPDLFARIREWIAAGRWEAEGAMWVEADVNLPCGESLVRQLLYGKRYLRDKLGVDSRVLWMPDVFGYSAALPQLMRLAGVDGFITSKISWSEFNRFPHDTFRWRGIDGTEVPTHFITTPSEPGIPCYTYNSMLTPQEVRGAWQEHRTRRAAVAPLVSFGYGDGGGGPTETMLENATRLAAWPAVTGMPHLVLQGARATIEQVKAIANTLPVWDGELYLEYHRGTYTTQGWIKRANRKNEIRLHNLEWLATLARLEWDKARVDSLWQDLLLLQFHDILPGSSVGEVYDEARLMHEHIAREADSMTDAVLADLCERIDTTGFQRPLILFNTLSWDRQDPIRLPDGSWRDDVVVPAGGWKVIEAEPVTRATEPSEPFVSADGRTLRNLFWEIQLDDCGRIAVLRDRQRDRSVWPKGAVANEWQVFQDHPLAWDAWDINLHYEQFRLPAPECLSIRVVENGPVRIAVEIVWQLQATDQPPRSTITQRLALYARHPRIDFETVVDWHERHQLLKVAFPVDVRATGATYEIQFGHLRRPTHRNTSWDVARFEVCAQRFVDISEHDFGVALLNDCKYGHDVHDGVIRLTCIKSPTAPDAKADLGRHEFTYSLLPHAGTFQAAGVIRAAAELNVPVLVRAVEPAAGDLPADYAPVTCDQDAVVIDTMKPAEDGQGQIVRMYESFGAHVVVTLTFAAPPRSVETVDLLEAPPAEDVALHHDDTRVSLRLRPFQIVSLRVQW